jgi:tetratricopeptide (TPR) repeat protein
LTDPPETSRRPEALNGRALIVSTPRVLMVVFFSLGALFAITTLAVQAYRGEKYGRAIRHFAAGERMLEEERYQEAIEEYRASLTFDWRNTRARVGLGVALMELGRLDEAEAYLNETLLQDPTNGLANLLRARIAASRGRVPRATLYYRRAIYGLWEEEREPMRLEAQFEFADLLAGAGERKQALAELMSLADSIPPEPALQKRLGDLFLETGSPENAADLYREVVKQNGDAATYSGLGRAEFEAGNFFSARTALNQALRHDPKSQQTAERLRIVNEVLSLDPAARRLSRAQRYDRSRRLAERSFAAFELCLAAQLQVPSQAAEIREEAREHLSGPPPRQRDEEGIEANLQLAEQLWNTRMRVCPDTERVDEVLRVLVPRLAR